MEFENKNILIYGMGKSGESAKALLLLYKANIFCLDDNISEQLKTDFYSPMFVKSLDYCVVSPGVSIFNTYIQLLQKYNVKILTEVELGAMFCKSKIISVTGTDGKTTTVTLLNQLLNNSNHTCEKVGNIGYPITQYVQQDNQKQYVVCELSSFMLEYKPKINTQISIITNVTADHLDRHKSLKNYIKSKQNAINNLNADNYCILNYDNKITKNMAKHTKAQTFFVSLNKKIKGCYILNSNIMFNNGKNDFWISNIKDLKLLGNHNLYNVLCCVCCALLLGISAKKIRYAIKNFKPLEHRLEYVASINNINFYNDSKATTTNSCLCAVESFNNVVLILGGKSKNTNFNKLCKYLTKKVKHIILIGETTQQIKNILNKLKFKEYSISNNLTQAVKLAYEKCLPFGTVLLSPACASFDMFSNYAERGEKFKQEVEKLKNETEN